MNKLISLLKRAPKRTAAALLMLALAIIVPATLFAWGPDRPTYTSEHPADHVTFNSITDNPNVGDERNFVVAKDAANTSDGGWSDNVTVQPGHEYLIRIYAHNNAASSLNLTAINTRVSATVPTTTGTNVPVSGFVTADNANPKQVWDDVNFNSSQNFNLAYIPGSAEIWNNGYAKNGASLPDSIVTSSGALIGYNGPDGKVPGCFQYANYIYIKVKPQFATPTPNFSVSKQVRKDGDKTFVDSVNANPGDTLNYRVTFADTGDTQLDNVSLKDTLPAGISFVPGTVQILNANNPSGAYIKDGDNLFGSGINIGSYTAGSNAVVVFNAKVATNDQLPTCGMNSLVNSASATVNGSTQSDTATVTVNKTCQPNTASACNLDTKQVETVDVSKIDDIHYTKDLSRCESTPPTTPPELPHTGPSGTVAGIVGLGSIVLSLSYYIASRRAALK